jgi:multidrug efflux system outer membrane protein
MKSFRTIAAVCLPLLLAACAATAPRPAPEVAIPLNWSAPLPHNGSVTDLAQWWREQNDPLLVSLIDAAQRVSPTLATAVSRIEQARATQVASAAALLPTLDAGASIVRSSQQSAVPLGTTTQAALQAGWELDLFGGNRSARRSAQARFEGAKAGWHEARVSVAAEVAQRYYSLRACEKLLDVSRADAASRAESSRLVQLATNAGFQSPALAGLARASAAESSGRVTQQGALCDIDVKALVALTAIEEAPLRQQIAAVPGVLPPAASIAIVSVPAQILAQRPDIFTAEREVAAAAADVDVAQAQRYPRLSLNGSVGVARFSGGDLGTNLQTWSIGPLALSVPLFDGGRRKANAEAAAARYTEAEIKYRASVRQAVREVEEALVNLNSTALRSADAATAVDGYRASFNGVESRYRNGLASLVELEDARRIRLAAETALVSLQRERVAAWIALYRAAGGGWNSADLNLTTTQ